MQGPPQEASSGTFTRSFIRALYRKFLFRGLYRKILPGPLQETSGASAGSFFGGLYKKLLQGPLQ